MPLSALRILIIETLSLINFDQNTVPEIIPSESEYTPSVASIALELGGLAIRFSQVERAPRYNEVHRENDAEHSYMLALVANELASRLVPELSTGLIAQYAIVHDLIETVVGDIATFAFTPEQMTEKHINEQTALTNLLQSLPPHTARLLKRYEEQADPESRFVKAVDKLLPVIVDIIGPGKKVMKETYGVTTIDELRASHTKLHTRIAESFNEFPLIVEAHAALCKLFQEEFEATTTLPS